MDNTERRIVIRRTSWHYRLVRWEDPNAPMPVTLCGYFWVVVGAGTFRMFFSMLMVVVMPIVGMFFGSAWLWNHRPWRRKAAEAMPHEPNLLVEWVKAKKRRVCPLIEVQ